MPATDAKGHVTELRTDRLPIELQDQTFDETRWKSDPAARLAMIQDLHRSRSLIGRTLAEAEKLLGPPTGRVPKSDRWELRIVYTWGLFGDRSALLWRPGGRYEPTDRRIGRWSWGRYRRW